ncbi:MAG: hypothetical protein PHS57_04460 [Alphaproteobacteria bacterium]|nr:hypothetical protein [Alphaproteobacteria bacterium]
MKDKQVKKDIENFTAAGCLLEARKTPPPNAAMTVASAVVVCPIYNFVFCHIYDSSRAEEIVLLFKKETSLNEAGFFLDAPGGYVRASLPDGHTGEQPRQTAQRVLKERSLDGHGTPLLDPSLDRFTPLVNAIAYGKDLSVSYNGYELVLTDEEYERIKRHNQENATHGYKSATASLSRGKTPIMHLMSLNEALAQQEEVFRSRHERKALQELQKREKRFSPQPEKMVMLPFIPMDNGGYKNG